MDKNAIAEELKARDERAAQEKADAEFNKLLNTPMTKEEAEVALADIDVKKMQLAVVRQKWMAQITQTQLNIAALDERMLSLDMERAMVFRRTLNTPAKGE